MPGLGWSWRTLALLGGLALSLWGTAFFAFAPRGPGAGPICAAAAAIRRDYRTGDHIVLLPAHATRARTYLGDLGPVALPTPGAEDLQLHARVWVLGLFGAASEARATWKEAGLEPVSQSFDRGVEWELYRNPAPWRAVWDATERVGDATVELHESGGRVRPCDVRRPRSGQGGPSPRWVCPRDSDWQYVATEWHRMGPHPRRCLWAHPPNEGELWIHFPSVPRKGELALRAGHTLQASRQARAPVELTVVVGDWAETHVIDLDDTWRPLRHALAPDRSDRTAGGTETATISFGVRSSDPGMNHFCFTADVRIPRGPR